MFKIEVPKPAGQSERAKTATAKQRLLKDTTQRQVGSTLKQYLLNKKEEQKSRLVTTIPAFIPALDDKAKLEYFHLKREQPGPLADSLDTTAVRQHYALHKESGRPSRVQTAAPKKPTAEKVAAEAPRQSSALQAKRPVSSMVYKRLTIHDLN